MLYHRDLGKYCSIEAGFSLLETLIALAIMSLASLALFQGSNSLMRTSDRAAKVGEGFVDRAVARHQVASLIAQLVPAWQNSDEIEFVGANSEFSGMSRALFDLEGAGVKPFKVRLEKDNQDNMKLVYQMNSQIWDLRTGLPANSKFQYLTPTNNWISVWPPVKNRFYARRDIEDASLDLHDLKLPSAIQLSDQKGNIIWISDVPESQNDIERFE